jgi:benzil reductase ((S)-benzoin forming)
MKNILITGSSSGLGFSLAQKFKKNGFNVYGISRSKTELDIKQQICDFSNPIDILPVLINLIDINEIDYVFLNAGILGRIDRLENITLTEYNQIFNVNVLSNKVILDYLMRNHKVKNVIGISSGAALKTYFGWSLYCMSKSAFKQLISSYADEYTNTNFLNLAPGVIKSKMQDTIKSTSVSEFPSLKKFHDMYKTMDSPDEVADKIIENLDLFKTIKSGDYLDLREI